MKLHKRFRIVLSVIAIFTTGWLAACGPIRPPKNAYQDAHTLIDQMQRKRADVRSFRIAGSIDHIQEQRIRGKAYIFAKLPDNLRIDVLSPFGNTLSVLTADAKNFGLSDYKANRFFSGKPIPCNVARFVGVSLPPSNVITILIGKIPILEGKKNIDWHPDGHYVVTITSGETVQTLHIGGDKTILPLQRAEVRTKGELIYDVTFDMWHRTNGIYVPYEIRIKMPKHHAELFIQYEQDGVELNVDLPGEAWDQTVPSGARLEPLVCKD